MPLRNPVELRLENKTIRIRNPVGNLSVGGLFVHAQPIPLDTPVHVRVAAAHPFEADGVVRFCEPQGDGLGIEFTTITDANRKRLDELIVELTKKEQLAS
jgi:hypothetical protein